MGHEARSDAVYKFESFCLDAGSRILTKKGKKVHLAGKPMGVLLVLVESAGKLVTKDVLQNKVWKVDNVCQNTIDQQITTLRRELGDTPDKHNYIETVPGQGFRFVAPVEIFMMEPPEPKCGFIDKRTGELVEVVDGTSIDEETEVLVLPGDPVTEGSPSVLPGDVDLSTEEMMELNNQGFGEQRTAIVDGRTQKKKRRHSLSPRTKSPLPPARPTHRSRRRDR
jgi:DNA-binding winged helix-turn-helix (wHTH) protein